MRRLPVLAAGVLLATSTAGCAVGDAAAGGAASPAAPTGTASTLKTSTQTAAPIVNDLANGAVTHTVSSAGPELTIRYWSTLQMNKWTPGVVKPLSLTITAASSGRSVYVSGFTVTMTTTPSAAGGPSQQTIYEAKDISDPGYLVTAPRSYAPIVLVPALPVGTRGVQLTVAVNLATGGYGSRAHADATDTLNIALN